MDADIKDKLRKLEQALTTFEETCLHVKHDHLSWYIIHFYDSGELALLKTTYEKAHQVADESGEVYEVFA